MLLAGSTMVRSQYPTFHTASLLRYVSAKKVSSESRAKSVAQSTASSALRAENKLLGVGQAGYGQGGDVRLLCWGNNQYGQLGLCGQGLTQKVVTAESLAKKFMSAPYKQVPSTLWGLGARYKQAPSLGARLTSRFRP